jgi:pimeloyl-ACP methyl ester carboxylesterase
MARRRYVQDPDGSFRLDYDLNLSKAFTHPASRIDLWPFFAQLKTIPTMVIRGALSDILSPETLERMQVEVPALQVVEVPGRGHVPNLDEPEAIAAIDRFLASLPPTLDSSTKAARLVDARAFAPHASSAGINGNG